MEESTGGSPGDPRNYFAAERTHLAWVRTGLAMMGFGFVVARFGLFLREVAIVHEMPTPHQQGLSLWFGTGLVLLGVIVNVCSAIRHWQTIRRLERQQPMQFRAFSMGTAVAVLLGLLGLLMIAYLLLGLSVN